MVVDVRHDYLVASQVSAAFSVFGTVFVIIHAIIFRKFMWKTPQRRALMMSVIVDFLQSLNLLIGDAAFSCELQGALSSFLQISSLLWITSATLLLSITIKSSINAPVRNLKRAEIACHIVNWPLALALMIINLAKHTYGPDPGLMASTVCWITVDRMWYRFGTLYIILIVLEAVHLVLAIRCIVIIRAVFARSICTARSPRVLRMAVQILSFNAIFIICWVVSFAHCIMELAKLDHNKVGMHIAIALLCPLRGFLDCIVITLREKFWKRYRELRTPDVDPSSSTGKKPSEPQVGQPEP